MNKSQPKCLVNQDGCINTHSPLYFCNWNDGDTRQIHTRETLYSMYKDTNLYDTDDSSLNEWGDNFESFNELLDHLSFNDENAFNGMFDNEVYRNDNMTIQRIY